MSTVASGQTKPYVETSNSVLFPSLVDIASINSVSRVIYSNAVVAFTKMVIGRIQTFKVDSCDKNKLTVGITMFGVTNPWGNAVKDRLHKEVHIIFELRDSNSLISHH